ncbi:MAG TPA: adenosylcobinamide-GDP ribazoletransferase [Ktedonobacteraceae bacterium]|jgi:adenosylcobinamide-GDP ribazoletransferase|nr:adenosylcobinamide-GDP ribazoletransferase [Ktedonobacteraceae bacterium]
MDNQHPLQRIKRVLLSQYREFAAAVRFLSLLPVPGSSELFEKDKGKPQVVTGCEYFPVVGLLLALILSLLTLPPAPRVPRLVLAALLVVALVILTGGLHLDGLMDTCDGLFGGRTRERKLEIMRDSRVGSFGVLAAICILLLKFALLTSVRLSALPMVLLIALPSARWAMVVALGLFPSARPTGLGAAYHQAITGRRLLLAGIISFVIVLIVGQLLGLIVWVAVNITVLLLGFWITQSIGGLTGDTYGAIEEVAEIMALLLLVMLRA